MFTEMTVTLLSFFLCVLLAGISHDKGFDISDPNVVGQNDLLIVGPGVLGRIIAEKWKKVFLAMINSSDIFTRLLNHLNIENHDPKQLTQPMILFFQISFRSLLLMLWKTINHWFSSTL